MGPKRSLLEASFQQDAAAKRPRRAGASTVAQQVAKALADNFKSFTEQEIDSTIVDGLSLRGTIARDKQVNKDNPGTITMGRLYYDQLRKKFANSEHPHKKLAIKDSSLVVRPELFQAMLASKRNPPQRQPMLQLLQNMETPPNHSELVGILRWMVALSPSLSSEQYQGVIQTMRWLSRFGMDKKNVEEVNICKPHFEQGLLLALSINQIYMIC